MQHVERLGYVRHWVAEHHNIPSIASVAPEVLMAHLAAVTSTIRIGSGGVMLPNHAPLAVAERFATLAALHPGRIDLGIGRAPGTDGATAAALRRPQDDPYADRFPEDLRDVRGFLGDGFPPTHPFSRIQALPGGMGAPARRCGCSGRAATARSSPAPSGCPSRSPTTSRRRTRCRHSSCTTGRSRRACCRSRTR